MPEVDVARVHGCTAAEARARLDELIKMLHERFNMTTQWQGKTDAKIERRGAIGMILMDSRAVRLTFSLSFALAPIRNKLEAAISEELQRIFPEPKLEAPQKGQNDVED